MPVNGQSNVVYKRPTNDKKTLPTTECKTVILIYMGHTCRFMH